jgi:hypothetical protein
LYDKALLKVLEEIQGSELQLEIQKVLGDKTTLTTNNLGKVLSYIARSMDHLQASNFLYKVSREVNKLIDQQASSFKDEPNKLRNFKAISN